MITLTNIFKWYSNKFVRTYVLRDVNFEINEGDFVTIMGPSGAGKSTLLHIMGMLDEQSDGEYHFLGEPVHKLGKNNARNYTNIISVLYFKAIISSTISRSTKISRHRCCIKKLNCRNGRVSSQIRSTGSASLQKRTSFPISYPADNSNWSVSPGQ